MLILRTTGVCVQISVRFASLRRELFTCSEEVVLPVLRPAGSSEPSAGNRKWPSVLQCGERTVVRIVY